MDSSLAGFRPAPSWKDSYSVTSYSVAYRHSGIGASSSGTIGISLMIFSKNLFAISVHLSSPTLAQLLLSRNDTENSCSTLFESDSASVPHIR